MNKLSLVSIVVNCFNGEKYLKHAITSIIQQSYQNWELIFWDNRSTDNSAKIFKSFEDKRLKYFYAPSHTSLYEARNCAISKCEGEFIAFLDVDDWWFNEKLEVQLKLFENQEVGLVYSNYYLYNNRTQKKKLISKKKLPIGEVTIALLSNYKLGILTVILRKSLFNKLGSVFDGRYNIIGDFDLFIKLSKISKFACIQLPLAYHRLHKKNYSSINRELEVEELEHWIENQKIIKMDEFGYSFKNLKLDILYKKTIINILNNNLNKAIKNIISFPLGLKKVKLIIALLMTRNLLKDYIN